jgi:hypothetical protein
VILLLSLCCGGAACLGRGDLFLNKIFRILFLGSGKNIR